MKKEKEPLKDETAQDTFILKLSGKAESPKPLQVANNVHLVLDGSITSEIKSDNQDGSFTYIWTFKPVKVETLDETGESLKLKDTRSNSQLIRSLVYKRWVNAASSMPFEDYYTKVCGSIMMQMDRIIDMAQVD